MKVHALFSDIGHLGVAPAYRALLRLISGLRVQLARVASDKKDNQIAKLCAIQ